MSPRTVGQNIGYEAIFNTGLLSGWRLQSIPRGEVRTASEVVLWTYPQSGHELFIGDPMTTYPRYSQPRSSATRNASIRFRVDVLFVAADT